MRAISLFALLLVSCTSYKSGVEANWVSSKTLKVSAAGNALTTDGRVEDYVMLKAAEKAIEAGYRYFVVTSSENTGASTTETINLPYQTTVSAHTYGGYYGPSTTFATATTTGGPRSYSVYRPGRDAVFIMFDGPPNGYRPGQYFDAVQVYNELGAKYLPGFRPSETLTKQPIDQPSTDVAREELSRIGATPVRNASATEVPTLDQVYRSLSDREKARVDSLPAAERAAYLLEIRSARY